mmetsp:Transcript_47365/g.148822  ORF Transcript_47365/g.148822 Transcript_47365/m.148822 type:complete len:229 (+) Transcript_47365:913-1599(+)
MPAQKIEIYNTASTPMRTQTTQSCCSKPAEAAAAPKTGLPRSMPRDPLADGGCGGGSAAARWASGGGSCSTDLRCPPAASCACGAGAGAAAAGAGGGSSAGAGRRSPGSALAMRPGAVCTEGFSGQAPVREAATLPSLSSRRLRLPSAFRSSRAKAAMSRPDGETWGGGPTFVLVRRDGLPVIEATAWSASSTLTMPSPSASRRRNASAPALGPRRKSAPLQSPTSPP